MSLQEQIREMADQLDPWLRRQRHHLHMHPELSFQEVKTTAFLQDLLNEWGLGELNRITETGGYVDMQGEGKGLGFIALRADLDALPIHELNQTAYRSTHDGVMHACGHDVHTTCLLGAMRILHQTREHWGGTVRFIFQPGEERLPGGASVMIREGVLQPDVQKILGQHVMPLLEVGQVGFRPGLYMASADEIYIKVIGKGGHGAHPQMNIDPVVIAAQLITELQTVVSRRAKPAIPSVLSIGKVIAEGSTNIIPDEVYMEGTFRTYDETWRSEAHALIAQICEGICQTHGARCEVEVRKGYPFLKNDESMTQTARVHAEEYLGAENVKDLDIWPAGEDFAYYSQEIPACFYRLGVRNESKGISSMVHTPTFDIDEDALKVGAGLMAWLCIRQLNES